MTLYLTFGVLKRARIVLFPTFDADQVLDAADASPADRVLRGPAHLRAHRPARPRARASPEVGQVLHLGRDDPAPTHVVELLGVGDRRPARRGLRPDRDLAGRARQPVLARPGAPARSASRSRARAMRVVDPDDPTREVAPGRAGRAAAARAAGVPGLLERPRGDRARRCCPAAGCAPATSSRWTPTASPRSSTGSRSSSSPAASTSSPTEVEAVLRAAPGHRRRRGRRPAAGAAAGSASSRRSSRARADGRPGGGRATGPGTAGRLQGAARGRRRSTSCRSRCSARCCASRCATVSPPGLCLLPDPSPLVSQPRRLAPALAPLVEPRQAAKRRDARRNRPAPGAGSPDPRPGRPLSARPSAAGRPLVQLSRPPGPRPSFPCTRFPVACSSPGVCRQGGPGSGLLRRDASWVIVGLSITTHSRPAVTRPRGHRSVLPDLRPSPLDPAVALAGSAACSRPVVPHPRGPRRVLPDPRPSTPPSPLLGISREWADSGPGFWLSGGTGRVVGTRSTEQASRVAAREQCGHVGSGSLIPVQ